MKQKKSLSQKIAKKKAELLEDQPTPRVTTGEPSAEVPLNRTETRAAARNGNLHTARAAKNDEFYTLLSTVEDELRHYRDHFKGKVVLCNCDDPESSNFFRYFALNFMKLELSKLISTHYESNGKSYALIVDKNLDVNGDGKIDLKDTVRVELEGNGDFRSEECLKFLKEADIVVTNVPFSLAREYLQVMKTYKKKFLFIGNRNMITYKEFFAEIKANRLWLGVSPMSCTWFEVPQKPEYKKTGNRFKIENGKWYRSLGNACWFTNLTHEKRNKPLDLVGNTYSPEKFPKFDYYDAIEVSKVANIPEDYKGAMAVPITFLDKYCPAQFDIVSCNDYRINDTVPEKTHGLIKDKEGSINGKPTYVRILIKLKPQKKKK